MVDVDVDWDLSWDCGPEYLHWPLRVTAWLPYSMVDGLREKEREKEHQMEAVLPFVT